MSLKIHVSFTEIRFQKICHFCTFVLSFFLNFVLCYHKNFLTFMYPSRIIQKLYGSFLTFFIWSFQLWHFLAILESSKFSDILWMYPTHRAGKREALKLTLLWLFHKFGFLKKQKFEKILILSISWSFENFDFFPRIEFYIFLRRFQTVPGGWPRLGISSWWNHIWNIFGTNFPPNQTKIDQSNC